jgi:hypothetical protein
MPTCLSTAAIHLSNAAIGALYSTSSATMEHTQQVTAMRQCPAPQSRHDINSTAPAVEVHYRYTPTLTTNTTTEHEHVGKIKLRHLSNGSQSQWPHSRNILHEAALRPWDLPHLAHTTPHPNTNTVARFSLLQCNPANSIHFHPLPLVLNTGTLDPCLSCLLAGLRSNLTEACTRIAHWIVYSGCWYLVRSCHLAIENIDQHEICHWSGRRGKLSRTVIKPVDILGELRRTAQTSCDVHVLKRGMRLNTICSEVVQGTLFHPSGHLLAHRELDVYCFWEALKHIHSEVVGTIQLPGQA